MRILLTECIPLLEEVLVTKLQSSGHIVTTRSPSDCRFMESVAAYELLWIDTGIFLEGGKKMLKNVMKSVTSTKVLLFGSNETIPEIKTYYMHGGHGYLRKDAEYNEIHMALTKIEEGGIYISFNIQKQFEMWISHTESPKKLIASLTLREKEILNLIVEENTTKEIAQKLHICPSTVETHRLKLIQKLDVKNSAGLVRVAFEQGLYNK